MFLTCKEYPQADRVTPMSNGKPSNAFPVKSEMRQNSHYTEKKNDHTNHAQLIR